MTIVVTGAAGFVGQRLVRDLLAARHDVVATDRSVRDIPYGARAVAGDLGDPALLAEVMRDGCRAIVHLATMPGGTAEADPAGARRINVDAALALLDAAGCSRTRPRLVFASSIAVFGDPLPAHGVDDETPLAPRMLYGAHKAMIEMAVATAHRRDEVDAVSLRLPAVVARPAAHSGLKSAFISNLFHALRAGEPMDCPVSADATVWVQSVARTVDNLIHALSLPSEHMPASRAVTLPALRVEIGALVAEVASQCGVASDLVRYRPDPVIQAAFGAQPRLSTPAADRAGFVRDGSLSALVSRALETACVPA